MAHDIDVLFDEVDLVPDTLSHMTWRASVTYVSVTNYVIHEVSLRVSGLPDVWRSVERSNPLWTVLMNRSNDPDGREWIEGEIAEELESDFGDDRRAA